MKHLKILFTTLGASGLLLLPALLQGQTVTQAQIDRHFQRQLKLMAEWRKTDREVAGLRKKIGTTLLTRSDRANELSLLGADRNKLRGYKAALDDGIGYLRAHWDQLTDGQRFEVQEEETTSF